MRSVLSVFAVVVVVAGLSGCGSSSSTVAESSSSGSIQSENGTVVVTESPAVVSHASSGHGAIHIDDSSFGPEITDYKGAALVDFNATWCGPCRKIGPVVEQIASEMGGRVKVGKVDVDKAPQTATQYDVHAIPCIVLFVDGKEVGRTLGYQSKSELQGWIQSMIPSQSASAPVGEKTASGIATLVE